MGCCISVPKERLTLNAAEISVILGFTACQNIILFDDHYTCIDSQTVVNWANTHTSKKYDINRFDCDDISLSFVVKFREWIYDTTAFVYGPCIGLISGDLKLRENDPYRGHAIAWFIDNKEELWLIEPQNGHIYKFEKWMSVFSIII